MMNFSKKQKKILQKNIKNILNTNFNFELVLVKNYIEQLGHSNLQNVT